MSEDENQAAADDFVMMWRAANDTSDVDTYFMEKPLSEAHLAGQKRAEGRIWKAFTNFPGCCKYFNLREIEKVIFGSNKE